jgi:hypothetical protein
LAPDRIRAACDASLRRLGIDVIDLRGLAGGTSYASRRSILGYPNFVLHQGENFRARLDRSTRRAFFLCAAVLTVVVLIEFGRAV